ncbi:MAG TPA: uroporphyrinogen-III C-methyltransferase [Verrucomicrobiae bacterium]|jgi:uroporphyrinogen III methyltransferase/synthase|nr:uroporphyrinogen-III C-methyltransferase [Verrucomicrobiae bacterium]
MKKKARKGRVYFVGAGPGDPGLLTLRGREVLERADVVLYDGLVHPGLLEFCPKARKIPAVKHPHLPLGREGGSSYLSQDQINRLLGKYASQGKSVARLKGGDPLIFGRGGEEALFLKKKNIPFEFIPGVSAGTGVPAYAGIPVTDRALSSQVLFVTGHEDPAKNERAVDWKALGKFRGTLVSFMAVKNLFGIARDLRAGGKSAATPAAVIERGTLPEQRTVEGTLADIAAKVKRLGVQSPALAVIGPVAKLRRGLAWFEHKPLFGKTIVVTRARSQAGELKSLLEREGARVLEFPAIEILPPRGWTPLDRCVKQIRSFDWVLFTSVHGVESFFGRLAAAGKDVRSLAGVRFAVIGDSTRRSLLRHGVKADLMPVPYHSGALVKAFRALGPLAGQKMLLPRTNIAPEFLAEELAKAGAEITAVTAYRTLPSREGAKKLQQWLRYGGIDYVVFTSSSTVTYFFQALKGSGVRLKSRFVSIGPVTSRTLRSAGKKVFCQAREHTLQGLVKALAQARR